MGGGAPAAHTPGSARSSGGTSSIADLEDTIVEVLGVRMQSLVDLRQRVDQLGDLYRREEETFRYQMRQVLERSEEVRVSNESREVELERALAKERADRTKVLELMSQFKREGAAVIQVMKESLHDATTKWKAELEKNAKLTAQLRRQGGLVSGEGPTRSVSLLGTDGSAAANTVAPANQQQQHMQNRIEALTQLVQEEDSIIVALRSRNRALEQRVAVLTQQRDKLLEVDADQCVMTGSLQGELYDVQQAVRRCDAALLKETGGGGTGSASSPSVVPTPKGFRLLAEKCDALDRYSKLLLQRLSIEQRQRLRVEEQSARIATAQDQLVHSLESRIKDLDRGGGGAAAASGGNHGSGGTTPKLDGQRLRLHRASSSSPLGSSALGGSSGKLNHAASGSSLHHEECSEAEDDDGALEVQEEFGPEENAQLVLPQASTYSRSSSVRGDAAYRSGAQQQHVGNGADQRSGSSASQPAQRSTGPTASSSSSVVPLSSLEAQLALVTREFHDSVDEWSREQKQIRNSGGHPHHQQRVSEGRHSAGSLSVNGDDL